MLSFSTTLKNIKALAIGCFDGLHLGHLSLIKALPPQNAALLIIDKFKGLKLCLNDDKKELCGLEVLELDFESIKNLSAEDFLKELKKSFENLELIVVGYDFVFGKNKGGKALDIEHLSGIKTKIIEEFKCENISVHTSLIKQLLSKGELKKANNLLGRNYKIKAKLIKGQGLGKKELVPTLNLLCDEYFLPKNGVYASFCVIRAKFFKSVSFIGIRSSDENFAIETHILEDFTLNLEYGEKIELIFVDFLRENAKFDDLKELKKQISKDIKRALELLQE